MLFILLERYLQLKIKAVKARVPIELKIVDDFITYCKHYGVKVRRLLCEFYLHNFVLEEEMEKNPSHFVGDIQLQEFISFVVNQIKWLKVHNTFQRQDNRIDLWVRSEPKNPLKLWAKHKSLMKKEGVIQILGPIHREIVQRGVEYFLSIKEPTIAIAKLQWKTSNRNIQEKKPFNYKNFKLAVNCLVTYSNLILREGPLWLGCRFQSPIIWYPATGYKAIYELPEGQIGAIFEVLAANHGCRPLTENPSLAYSLTDLHVNYMVFMRA